MKVILNEIKKLFNIRITTITAIGALVIYSLFIGFWIKYFPQGIPDKPHFELSELMLRDYGVTIDEEEMQDFVNKTKALEKEADKYILERKEFAEAGVTGYKDFKIDSMKGENDEVKHNLYSKLMFENGGVQLFIELESRYSLINSYYTDFQGNLLGSGIEVERIENVINRAEFKSVLSFVTFNNYKWIISNCAWLVVVTVGIIISLVFIKDRLNGVDYLQYTSKVGRKIVKKKVIAAFIVTFIIITLELLVILFMYSKNNTLQFWNCSLSGVFSLYTLWFDLTFGEYIMITIGLIYILGFSVTSIGLFISKLAKSYISLIGIQVPILLVLGGIISKLGLQEIFSITFPKYTPHIIYGVITVISVILLTSIMTPKKELQ